MSTSLRPPRSTADANIAAILWGTAQLSPSRVALTDLDSGESRTYAELRERVARVAAGLTSRIPGVGARIALLMRNSIAYVEAFLGVAAAGHVAVPMNIRLTDDDFRHMLRDSGSAALIADPDFIDRLEGSAELSGLSVFSTGAVQPVASTLEELASSSDMLAAPRVVDGEDLCSLMYTSGTTGKPKAVMLPHRSWRAVSDTAADVLRFGDDEAVLHVAPLTHGSGFLLLPTLANGGVNLLCRSFNASRTAELLSTGKVTTLFMVPSMIRMLLDAMPLNWRPAARLRNVYYAGSPIDPHTFLEAFDRLEGRLVQSFGQMESPMFLTVLDEEGHRKAASDEGSRYIRSAGRILPGVRLRIIDANGRDVETMTVGEIVARAPQVMLGYWNRPEETSRTLEAGWLHTGDLGYLDAEGYLYVVDRLKDMIITGGSNVYAREVEEVLIDLPGVREAAVVGIAHRIWGEAVTAVLVADSKPLPDDVVIAHCRARLAGYKVPKSILWVDSLPRNAYGKVLKADLRRQISGDLGGQCAGGLRAR